MKGFFKLSTGLMVYNAKYLLTGSEFTHCNKDLCVLVMPLGRPGASYWEKSAVCTEPYSPTVIELLEYYEWVRKLLAYYEDNAQYSNVYSSSEAIVKRIVHAIGGYLT